MDDRELIEQLKTMLAQRSTVVPVTKSSSVEEFADWLRASGKADLTIKTYVKVLRSASADGLNIMSLSAPAVIDYASRATRSKSPRTLGTYYSALRKWAEFTGQSFAVGALKAPTVDPEPRALPPEDDVAAIRDAMRVDKHDKTKDALTRRRDGAIFDLLFEGAMRISEVLALELDDVQVKHDLGYKPWPVDVSAPTHVFVRRSKRGKSRYVPLTPLVAKSLANWIRVHRPRWAKFTALDDSTTVFTGRYGEPMSYNAYHNRLKAYGAEVGVSTVKGRTHTGRRFKITTLISNGAKPSAIIRHTGHKSVKELEPYILLSDTSTEREWLDKS